MRESDPVLEKYIAKVRHIPSLTREQEHELATRWRHHNDVKAGEELVQANLRHVVSIALSYRHYGARIAELIAEGNVGLVNALRKFDPDKGTRFVTYAAYWIRAYVLAYVIRTWSLVGGGSGALRSKLFFQLRRARARLAMLEPGQTEALERLATQLNMPVEKLSPLIQRLEARDVSLDLPAFADSEATRMDLLQSEGDQPDQLIEDKERASELGDRVSSALSLLDTRERYIVEQRLLADEEMSLAELGRRLGVSRERARQLEARAKRKLRASLADLEVQLSNAA